MVKQGLLRRWGRRIQGVIWMIRNWSGIWKAFKDMDAMMKALDTPAGAKVRAKIVRRS